jgi:hypothetical protein
MVSVEKKLPGDILFRPQIAKAAVAAFVLQRMTQDQTAIA